LKFFFLFFFIHCFEHLINNLSNDITVVFVADILRLKKKQKHLLLLYHHCGRRNTNWIIPSLSHYVNINYL